MTSNHQATYDHFGVVKLNWTVDGSRLIEEIVFRFLEDKFIINYIYILDIVYHVCDF